MAVPTSASRRPKSPADGTKLKADDVIVAVNGRAVHDSDAFIRLIGRTTVDQPAKLQVWRERKQVEVAVTPKRRPLPPLAVNIQTQRLRWRGITLTAVPANWSPAHPGEAVPSGVYIVGIEDAEIGKKLGIKPGQIITSIAGQAVKSVADLQKLIDSTPLDDVKLQTADSAAIATAQQ